MSSKTASARPGHDRASLYDEITGKIIAELEAGRVPWVQPWGTAAAKAPLAMPKNAATGRQYSGINVLILWGAVIEHGFPAQSWLTFRQALSLGGNVRKGEHGTTVVYADRFVPDDEKRRARETGEEAAAIPFLKRFTVFNAAQCENLPADIAAIAPPPLPGLIEPRIEALIRATGVDFRIGGNRAFYAPGPDYVMVPPPQAYFEPINWHRTALHELGHASGHPLDQFRAFLALRDKGRSEEDIAAAFFVRVNVVKQRLRLASVAPALLDVYAEDGMSLEQLMAFTVTADRARQEQVWQAVSGSWQKEPYQIRRMLTEKTVRASDRRAVFVGLDAYEAAGGVVLRDLFQSDDGGWLEDIALLDGLVAEKLKTEAETIAAEGWKWIEVAIDFPYGHTHGLRELEGVTIDLTSEEQATIDALKAEYAKLEEEYDGADELPDEVDERLGEIEAALAAFDDRPVSFEVRRHAAPISTPETTTRRSGALSLVEAGSLGTRRALASIARVLMVPV
jgi:antirestriction protein ArdC